MPKVMALRAGAFAKHLGHEDGAPMNGISAIMKETTRSSRAHVETQQEDGWV